MNTVEDTPHRACELVGREWLRDIGFPAIEHAMMNDGGVGIAGHEQHSHFFPDCGQQISENATTHLRHHGICQEQIDGACVATGELESIRRPCRFKHVVAIVGQHAMDQVSNVILIFYKHDRFAPAGRFGEHRLRCRVDCIEHCWEVDLERRASTGLAIEPDVPPLCLTIP